jgi:hypothetical protein
MLDFNLMLTLHPGAIHTLLRIFDAYGDQLSPEAWSMCLQNVMFRLLSSIEAQLKATSGSDSTVSEKDKAGWNETTVVVLSGITNLLAEYLDKLSAHHTFGNSWEALLAHFKTFLEFQVLEISTAIFKALRQILSKGNINATKNFDKAAIDLAWALWSHSLPVIKAHKSDKRFDNQEYLLAYVSALSEIYRLVQQDLGVQQVERMLVLLRQAIQEANAATYTADIEYLTPLQTQVLESLKMIRTDIEGVPAALISQVADFVGLAYEPNEPNEKQRPTYVALSKAAMNLSESLILAHARDPDIYLKGAVSSSLIALGKPIVLKYSFPIMTKSIPPWKQATTSSLAILKAILPVLTNEKLKGDAIRSIWSGIVAISNGITAAHCNDAPKSSDIMSDQDFDITSFLAIRDLIIPSLGSPTIPDKTRRAYTESLFHMSLIHAAQLQEVPIANQELLAGLYMPRKGCTIDPPPSPRSKMSYVCFDELVSLVMLNDSSTPRIKLAQAAAPYLILRIGLTLRAYTADQPLRGWMPQPLSQRKELLYVLRALTELKCEPEAIPDTPGVESEGRKHLHRLYPLLAKAIRAAARDQEVLELIGRALDEVGMEFGV